MEDIPLNQIFINQQELSTFLKETNFIPNNLSNPTSSLSSSPSLSLSRFQSLIHQQCVSKLQSVPYLITALKYLHKRLHTNTTNNNTDFRVSQLNENPTQEILLSSPLDSIHNINTHEFNIFHLEKEVGSINTLPVVSIYIFTAYGLYSLIPHQQFEYFVKEITNGYVHSNPYHNDIHAADITQTSMIYMNYTNLKSFLRLNDLDYISLFISCIIHDYKHPGYNNMFLSNTNDKIALMYNDISVLENYHISQAFELIHSNEMYNIFSMFSKEEYTTIRKRIIGLVLSTDMSYHGKHLSLLKDNIKKYEIVKGLNREKIINNESEQKMFQLQQDFLNLCIHASDISNPTKPFDIYEIWADKVINEFWKQGDKERELGLKISNGYDRHVTTKAMSQVGFIDFVVMPFFVQFVEVFGELEYLVKNIEYNVDKYRKIKSEEDKNKQ